MGKTIKSMQPHSSDDELYSLKEAAAFLKIGRSSIFGLVADGKIPYSRPLGRKRLVWRSDLVKFIDNRRVAAL
jgi:excisionase family DNA binding protein